MAKKKKPLQEQGPEAEMDSPFVGGEEDDLMDMEYIQDETTSSVDTHPPETKEEAAALAEGIDPDEVEDPTPVEEEKEDVQPEAEEKEEEAVAEEEETVLEPEPEVQTIPKERFDEVNERMKKAEKEKAELKAQLENVVEEKSEPEPEPYDYATQEKAAMDALLEGDTEKYTAIRNEIRLAEKEETLREAKQLATAGDEQLRETMTFEEVGAQIETDYPQFVPDSDVFNNEAREEMLDLYVGYAKSGLYTRTQALRRAADRAVKIYGFDEVQTPEPAPDNVVDIKKTDPKKKAEVANSQPPVMESSAEGSSEEPRRDYSKMSDEEFDALPESTKKRARGDIL